MDKFASTIILVAAIISVQGGPITYDEILAAAKEGQWDQVQDLLKSNLAKNAAAWKPPSFNSVRELKPTDGGHVYGEAEYSFHSASNIDGKTSEDHAGHKVINNDGKVKEFDFTPSTELPLLPPIITGQAQLGNDYGASDYSFHYAPTGVGETAEYIGGKKVTSKQHQPHTIPSALKLPLPIQPITSEPSQKSPEEDYDQADQGVHINKENVKDSEVTPSSEKPPPYLQRDGIGNPNPIQSDTGGDTNYEIESASAVSDEAPENPKPQADSNNGMEKRAKSAQLPIFQGSDGLSNPKPPEDGSVNGDGHYIESASAFSGESLIEAVNEDSPNNNNQNVDNSNNQNEKSPLTPQPPESVLISKTVENVFPRLVYTIESASATSDELPENKNAQEFGNNNKKISQIDTKTTSEKPLLTSTRTRVRKQPPRMDQDYIVHVASAIDDELEQMSEKIKRHHHKKKPFGAKRTTYGGLPYPLSFTGVRDLKPEKGGHVYGEAQYAFHTATNVNGKTMEEQGGHKLINNDGKIKEFDFQPKTIKPFFPAISFTEVRDLKPPQGGQVYGEAQYAYHSATNVNGQTSEEKGGHKVINNNGKVKEFDFTPSPGLSNVGLF